MSNAGAGGEALDAAVAQRELTLEEKIEFADAAVAHTAEQLESADGGRDGAQRKVERAQQDAEYAQLAVEHAQADYERAVANHEAAKTERTALGPAEGAE